MNRKPQPLWTEPSVRLHFTDLKTPLLKPSVPAAELTKPIFTVILKARKICWQKRSSVRLFLDMILDNFPVLSYESIDYEVRCRLLFMRCWKYVTGRPSELKFYMRYYHSLMYNTYSFVNHTKQYSILVDKLRSAFPAEGGGVELIMRHILDTLLTTALMYVSNPEGVDSDEVAEMNFKMIFSVVREFIDKNKLAAAATGK